MDKLLLHPDAFQVLYRFYILYHSRLSHRFSLPFERFRYIHYTPYGASFDFSPHTLHVSTTICRRIQLEMGTIDLYLHVLEQSALYGMLDGDIVLVDIGRGYVVSTV